MEHTDWLVKGVRSTQSPAMHACKAGAVLGIFLVVLLLMSCAHDEAPELPEVPAFESLGFAGSLDAVRNQMLGVYEKWQEKPLDAGRNGRLAMHLSVYDKLPAAEVLYRRALALAPDDFRWTYYLAVTLNELGRNEEAAGMFREALRLDPEYANARLRLARLLLESDHTGESRELYHSFSVEFPERVEGWLGLGKIYSRIGDNDAAAAALRRALELGPEYGEIHYAFAFVLRAMGDKDAAARELAAYQRTAHNKVRMHDPLLRVVNALYAGDSKHYEKAVYQYRRADFKNASRAFRDTLSVNPANVDAWAGLVSAEDKLGDIDAAGDAYREALAAGTAYARLHLVYGQALLDRRQLDAAREAVGRAIELDPQYADALSVMGEIEMLRGESVAAVKQFRLLLLARPNDPSVELSLAQALNAAARFDEAADLLEPLMTSTVVERALVLKELALAYRGLGRNDAALDALVRGREAVRKTSNIALEDTIEGLLARWRKEPAD